MTIVASIVFIQYSRCQSSRLLSRVLITEDSDIFNKHFSTNDLHSFQSTINCHNVPGRSNFQAEVCSKDLYWLLGCYGYVGIQKTLLIGLDIVLDCEKMGSIFVGNHSSLSLFFFFSVRFVACFCLIFVWWCRLIQSKTGRGNIKLLTMG